MGRWARALAASVLCLSACGPGRSTDAQPPPEPLGPPVFQRAATGQIQSLSTIAGQPIDHLTVDRFDEPILLTRSGTQLLEKLDSSGRLLWTVDLGSELGGGSAQDFIHAHDGADIFAWTSAGSATNPFRFDANGQNPSQLLNVRSGTIRLTASGEGDLAAAIPSAAQVEGVTGPLWAKYSDGSQWQLAATDAVQFEDAALSGRNLFTGAHVLTTSPVRVPGGGPTDAGFYLYGFGPSGTLLWSRKLPPVVTGIERVVSGGGTVAVLASVDQGELSFGSSQLSVQGPSIAIFVVDQNVNPLWASVLPRQHTPWSVAIGLDGSIAAANNDCGQGRVRFYNAQGSLLLDRTFGGEGCAAIVLNGLVVTHEGPLVAGSYQGRVDFGDGQRFSSTAASGFLMQLTP